MSLENEMLRVGRVIAADHRLTVEVRGSSAYAMPGKIVLPSIAEFAHLGVHARRMLHGLLDHECGHALFTDFKVSSEAAEKDPFLKTVWNAIEDGWIEREMSKRYIGTGTNLKRKNEWFWTDPKWRASFTSEAPANAFVRALTLLLRRTTTVPEVIALRADMEDYLALIEDEIREGFDVTTTRGALVLAERIVDKLRLPAPPPEDASGDDEDGESGEQKGASGSDDDAPPEDDADDAEDADGESSEDEGTEKEAPKPLDTDLDPDGEPRTPEEAFNAEVKQTCGADSYRLYTEDEEFIILREHASGVPDTNELAAAQSVVEPLVLAFETALRAKREKRYVTAYDEGDVDPSMLVEYSLGGVEADTIYQQAHAEDDRDVAVAILIDCSGSMSRTISVARKTAYALSIALSRVQIAHEVTGFTTAHGKGATSSEHAKFAKMASMLNEEQRRGNDPCQYAREVYGEHAKGAPIPAASICLPQYHVFKSFDADRIDGIAQAASRAENLDGEAVLWQARRLAQRREPRRVMFVLSDGYPAGHRRNVDGRKYLKNTVTRVVDAGIEVYGIGICTDAPTQFYPRSWVVSDISCLSEIALGAMVEVLVEARQEARCVTI